MHRKSRSLADLKEVTQRLLFVLRRYSAMKRDSDVLKREFCTFDFDGFSAAAINNILLCPLRIR